MRFPALSRHANCDWLICLSALTTIGQSNNDNASVFVFRRQTATKVTKDLRSLLLIATRQPNVFRAFNRVIILESFLRTRYYRKNSRKGSAPWVVFLFVNLLWFKYKRRIPLLCTLTFVKSLNTTASFWHPSGVMLLIRVRSLLTSPSWRPMTLMNGLLISFIEIRV